MKFAVIVPAHNEQENLPKMLDSLLGQSLKIEQIIVVNDNSQDHTKKILEHYKSINSCIESVYRPSQTIRLPGAKIVQAFNDGLALVRQEIDIICKFDADLVFPNNYIEKINDIFSSNSRVGMAAGVCCVEKNGVWKNENLTDNTHIRGALKAYRRECFNQIGGLRQAMGWDTVDELLARYYSWEVVIDNSLMVKHLRQTATQYGKKSSFMQGEAFYRMGYGEFLTIIASFKLAYKKSNMSLFWDYWQGFLNAHEQKKSFLVTKKQGAWIRKYRWKRIFSKIIPFMK